MKFLKPATIIVTLLASSFSIAQSYVGHSIDNYSGIHGVVENPSNIVDSRFKTDVNIASVSTFIGSDYYAIDFNNVFNDSFDAESNAQLSSTDTNNFFTNVEVVGPSFMFNLNDKNSVGLITRVRGFANVNNINGALFESLVDEFEGAEDYVFDSSDLITNTHVWAEIGFAYGRVLYNEKDHFLKAGITLKLLQGAGVSYFNSPGFSGSYNATTETISTNGSINYGTINDINNGDDYNFDNLETGFGADIGVTYEWRKNNDTDHKGFNKYLLKLGLSITDIGSISYKNINQYSFDLENQNASTIGYEDAEQFLNDNYTSVQTTNALKINLPTALRFTADYHIDKSIYVSMLGAFSMVKDNKEFTNKINNSVTLSPRIETKWFSFYSPVSFRQYDDFAWGAGFRLGPLTVGSGSILSNVISKESRTTDIYVGLKVPIYQSRKTE